MPDAHRHAAAAYGTIGRVAIDQRELEANALLKAAHSFEEIRRAWCADIGPRLNDALLYNRKLWTIFATDAASDDNPLPLSIRNGIANLSIFIFKRTIELQASPTPDKIDALIEINKTIAAGLLDRPGAEGTTADHTVTPPPPPAA